jgi:hypothetical protein
MNDQTDKQKEFKREWRYIVVKRKKLLEYAQGEARVAEKVEQRILAQIPEEALVECVVVESDWPEYETVWKLIEARVTGAALDAAAPVGDAPSGWRDAIADIRQRVDNDTPSAYDNEGYRRYADIVIDSVIDALNDLEKQPTTANAQGGEATCDYAPTFDAWFEKLPAKDRYALTTTTGPKYDALLSKLQEQYPMKAHPPAPGDDMITLRNMLQDYLNKIDSAQNKPGDVEPVAWLYKIRGGNYFTTLDVASTAPDDNFWRNRDDGEYELLSVTPLYTQPTQAPNADAIREIIEIYAGMEGFETETAAEAYALRIIEEMYEVAANAVRTHPGTQATDADEAAMPHQIRDLISEIANEAYDNGNSMDLGAWLPVAIAKLESEIAGAIRAAEQRVYAECAEICERVGRSFISDKEGQRIHAMRFVAATCRDAIRAKMGVG